MLHIAINRGVFLLLSSDEYMQLSVEVRKGKKDAGHAGESPLPSHCTVFPPLPPLTPTVQSSLLSHHSLPLYSLPSLPLPPLTPTMYVYACRYPGMCVLVLSPPPCYRGAEVCVVPHHGQDQHQPGGGHSGGTQHSNGDTWWEHYLFITSAPSPMLPASPSTPRSTPKCGIQ